MAIDGAPSARHPESEAGVESEAGALLPNGVAQTRPISIDMYWVGCRAEPCVFDRNTLGLVWRT